MCKRSISFLQVTPIPIYVNRRLNVMKLNVSKMAANEIRPHARANQTHSLLWHSGRGNP